MVFDKNAHFSMNLMKAVCADETEVLTCKHSDLDYLEDVCRSHKAVAYIADGTYSLGGVAPVRELTRLQQQYGLFLYFDDSHSLSVQGTHGEGHVRSSIDEVNSRTIIVATLNKAYGTSGAAVMMGPNSVVQLKTLERFGGPMAWSQPMNIPAIGASLASAEIHASSELGERQTRLQNNIALFDQLISSPHAGEPFPIKLVPVGNDAVLACAKALFEEGYYVSPVFFPIVARNEAGLRVMLRATLTEFQIRDLATALRKALDAERHLVNRTDARAG